MFHRSYDFNVLIQQISFLNYNANFRFNYQIYNLICHLQNLYYCCSFDGTYVCISDFNPVNLKSGDCSFR